MAPPSATLIHSLDHNTLGKTDIAVQSVLLAIVFVAVGLRLWSRRLQCIPLKLNDLLIIVATFFMIGRYVVEIIMVVLCGMGLHSTEVAHVGGTEVFIQFNELTYAGDLLWVTVIALIQLSILNYYVHNFRQRAIALLAYVIMSLCSALWVAAFFATAFFCTPPKKIWLVDTPGHCGDRKMLHTGVHASETILSFFIVILPIPLILDIPLSKTRKAVLVCIQVLGLAIISIIAVRTKLEFDLDPGDPTHGSVRKSILSCIVPLLGIIVACLPTLEPALQRIFRISALPSPVHTSIYDPTFARYWRTTVLSGRRLEELEMPLVTVTQPFMAKMGHLAPGHIQVTSHWEIHSSRGSARLDRSPVRQA
ncbi:hypothetical protein N7517_007674 [Penicillium concentricum]|uniref:Rhodopsin domain-containing protein n=1 Tax=Penicillium concentricum TaxID=293559 RepID=A0A9W9VB61_9EURO|nr:uncharacterized protein N7517_007674 [Penicillium concentricum]KAJ5375668.1 hypothetical protein N7517_007674 [Penicillium concentricum]